jgi:hypothetical protein
MFQHELGKLTTSKSITTPELESQLTPLPRMIIDTLIAWSRSPSISSQPQSPATSSSSPGCTISTREREPVHLPDEVVLQIISYLPEGKDTQTTLAACCLVSWQWYNITIARLYERPYLYGKNFDPFVKTICPSLNVHVRKSDLAGLVRELNMSALVHQGSKSTTARLLGRTKAQLETYVAPQANFGINCLAALSKCTALRQLDLSLVSEAMTYRELSAALRNLKELRTLAWPRCASKQNIVPGHPTRMEWPPKLEDLRLSGDLYALMLNDVQPLDGRASNLPPALTNLTIRHCSLDLAGAKTLLQHMGEQLKYLKVCDMTRFPSRQPDALNNVLVLCPNLETLVISHTYISDTFVSDYPYNDSVYCKPWSLVHPLKNLELVEVGVDGFEQRLDSIDLQLWFTEDAFPHIEKVVIRFCTGYFPVGDEVDDWTTSGALLRQRAERDGRDTVDVGVFLYRAY